MIASEHYAEAERLLLSVQPAQIARTGPMRNVDTYISHNLLRAVAHAVLSLAAPTADDLDPIVAVSGPASGRHGKPPADTSWIQTTDPDIADEAAAKRREDV